MINSAALFIAKKIKSVVPEHPSSVNVLKFAIALVINAVAIISLSLIISLFTGKTLEVVQALISFAALRQVSGGKHINSGIWCVAVSTGIMTAVSYAIFTTVVSMILTIASLILILIYAPSGIERQSRIPKRYYPLLKLISFLLVASNFLIQADVLSITFFIQALLLIKIRG